MRVLWLTNILPHFLAEKLHTATISNLGWIDYSAEKLLENRDISLHMVFPSDTLIDGECFGIRYYVFPTRHMLHRADNELVQKMCTILKQMQPDIIHIYGTEYYHTVAMAKATKKMGLLDRTLISIQGLVSVYAHHYMADLPPKVRVHYTVHDLIKRENLVKQRQNYFARGEAEREALRLVPNVIGRTEWDKACTLQINPSRKYFFCNETLRKVFYTDQWQQEACMSHTLFVSQSSYSIKALHQVVECMPLLTEHFPGLKVFVTGQDVFAKKWYRINAYHAYLKKRIFVLGLRDRVVFLGRLNEAEMKQQYLQCNVFVMPSSVENSPNSLGEAMILGTPCIAANVGGIPDMFVHCQDGFLYPFDAPYMLAHYIRRIFTEPDTVESITRHARQHAMYMHNPDSNLQTLLSIYSYIARKM